MSITRFIVRFAKLCALYLMRTLGMFSLGRYLNRNALVIICYHGISIRDEHRFLPALFVSAKTFAKRMRYLAKYHNVLGLEVALKEDESLRHKAVITFDDGFYNFGLQAVPIMKYYGFPATVYLSTYYVEHQLPIPYLMASYLIKRRLSKEKKENRSSLKSDSRLKYFLEEIKELTSQQKDVALRKLTHELGVSYDEISESRMFHLLNPLEVRAYALEGFDFQLHTHRHRNVVDNLESIAAELMENKERIIELTGKEPKHFAYPSGRWNKQAWLQLQKSGVISAVTMDAGLNYADADHLCLRRIFDSESNWQVEFEWITCGIKENIYSVVAQFRHLLGVKK